MSYYFAIVGIQDNPLFEYEFGTSKQGGNGQSRFSDQLRHLNQFILHASLDIAEEVQWAHGQMYLKCIDKFFNNYISCFVTAANVKFLLLHQPSAPSAGSSSRASTAIGANPTSPATEEAIKMFFVEVYENWVKAIMSPFYKPNSEINAGGGQPASPRDKTHLVTSRNTVHRDISQAQNGRMVFFRYP